MDDDNIPTLEDRLKTRAHDGKSALYQYLRRQHRTLGRSLAKHDPSWASIAAEIAADGVMGRDGKPASSSSVRNMWMRVCRDLEAERKARKTRTAERGVQPSRVPATWRPPVVQPARAAEPPRSAPPNTVPARAAPRELSEKAKATLAALDRQLDHTDRFVNPPKRKD